MTAFDADRREALVGLVRRMSLGAPEGSVPAVSVEAFFDGNRDLGSIGCNLDHHPGIPRFLDVLLQIRQRPDVQDVLVGIHDASDPTSWPFSETVYVLTDATGSDVEEWAAELQPDEVTENEVFSVVVGLPSLKAGMKTVQLWWD